MGDHGDEAFVGPASVEGAPEPVARRARSFEVAFPDDPTERIRIRTRRSDIEPGDLEVERIRRYRRTVTTFATQSPDGGLLVPTRARIRCVHCGASVNVTTEAQDVVMHVVGPRTINRRRAALLAAEVRRKVRPQWPQWPQTGYVNCGAPATGAARQDRQVGEAEIDVTGTDAPEPFVVSRRGVVLCELDPAILEMACARVPELNAALDDILGWGSAGEAEDPARVDGECAADRGGADAGGRRSACDDE